MSSVPSRNSLRTIAVLSVTQIIAWGTSYDMLGVMGRVIAPDLALPNEVIFFGLSIMMLTSAFCGPTTGRLLDRHGAAKVMAASSVAFAAGLLLLSATGHVAVYVLAWMIIGVAGSLGLSASTYTAVVEREGLNGRRTIAILMLFTGLSVTVFWPVMSWLEAHLGWRMSMVIGAALHIFICLPLYLFGLPKRIAAHDDQHAAELQPVDFSPAERRKAFILVATATSITSFVSFGLSPSLLAVLRAAGAAPDFALQLGSARGAIGVSARLVDMTLGKRGNALITSVAGTGLTFLSFLAAASFSAQATLVVFILLYGFGTGVMAVARALLPLSLFSPKEFGLQSARLSMPQNLANGVAPVIFTAILDRVGVTATLLTGAALSATALILVLFLARMVRDASLRSASGAQ